MCVALFAIVSSSALGQYTMPLSFEYIEGWGNSKAIEGYNPTNIPNGMSDYRLGLLERSPSAEENQKVQLSGILQPNDVLVFVSTSRIRMEWILNGPCGRVGRSGRRVALPVYDVNNVMYFNGNDTVVFARISDNTNLDIFGVVGQDPGDAGWGHDQKPHPCAEARGHLRPHRHFFF